MVPTKMLSSLILPFWCLTTELLLSLSLLVCFPSFSFHLFLSFFFLPFFFFLFVYLMNFFFFFFSGLLLYQGEPTSNVAPLHKYFYISFSNTIASFCQYESLRYISFPTQTLGKCGKMIPVMIIRFFFFFFFFFFFLLLFSYLTLFLPYFLL